MPPTSPAAPSAPALRHTRTPEVRRTLILILWLNALVLAVKAGVGVRTGSLAVLGAALESTLDLLNNVMGLVLVRVAARGPDEDHPYGHEKFETLGALAIVGFLSISCFELLRQSAMRVISGDVPRAPSHLELALVASTIAINILVVVYERRQGERLRSPYLLADAAHTHSDVYVTLAALGSLVLTHYGYGALDPALTLVVAAGIGWSGYEIVRRTVPVLVDERAVDEAEIRRLLGAIPRVQEVRRVRSRALASGVLFAEVTIGVDAATSVAGAHVIADAVEARIEEALGASEVTVHVEPV